METLIDICRICMKQDETLVNNINDWIEIVEIISQIKLNLCEEFPQRICDDCVQQLITANEIRNLIIQSNNYFERFESEDILMEPTTEEDDETVSEKQEIEIIEEDDKNLVKYAIVEEVLVEKSNHDDTLAFRCCICDENHETFDDLESHSVHTHNKKLNFWVKDDENDNFCCFTCEKNFISTENLNRHRMCGDCGKYFATSESLLVHTQKKSCLEESRKVTKHVENAPKPKKHFGCCRCPEIFDTEDICRAHFDLKHIEDRYSGTDRTNWCCKVCFTPFLTKIDLQKHVKAPRIKTYVCDQCNEQFSSFPKYKLHIETMHETTQEFGCDECEKVYDRLESLRYHKYMHHNEKNNRLCPDCGKVFKKKVSFIEHRNIHLGLRPHVCELCKSGFTSTGALRTHMRSHTGAKPFKCKWCTKRYSHYSDMKRHSYSHTGDYPFVCETCNKGFAKRSALTSHAATHESREDYK